MVGTGYGGKYTGSGRVAFLSCSLLFCFVNHDDRMYLDKFKRILKAI